MSVIRRTMSASGIDALRHANAYIVPFLGSNTATHQTGKVHDDIPIGTNLILHELVYINGKTHVRATVDMTNTEHIIIVSKIQKPGAAQDNAGHSYETHVIDTLKACGLMPQSASGAGSSGGTDFVVQTNDELLNGEVKQGITAAFGQLTLNYILGIGWHIKDSNRIRRKLYAEHVDRICVEDKTLIEHLNEFHVPGETITTKSGRAKTFSIQHTNLDPANAYLCDHHVDLVHVGTHGTYRINEKLNWMPRLSGIGKWIIRQKSLNPFARTAQFIIDGAKGLCKSPINIVDNANDRMF